MQLVDLILITALSGVVVKLPVRWAPVLVIIFCSHQLVLVAIMITHYTGQKVKFPALQKTYNGYLSEVSCTFYVYALMKYTAQFLRLVDKSRVTNIISFIFCVQMKLLFTHFLRNFPAILQCKKFLRIVWPTLFIQGYLPKDGTSWQAAAERWDILTALFMSRLILSRLSHAISLALFLYGMGDVQP